MLALVSTPNAFGNRKAQPKLKGVFQYVDFSNKDRFTDELLDRLLTHFETVRMRTCDVDSHILGNSTST